MRFEVSLLILSAAILAAEPPPSPEPAKPAAPPLATQMDPIQPEDIAPFPRFDMAWIAHPPSTQSILRRAKIRYAFLYEDVGRELGLTAGKQQRLVDLLVAHHVEAVRPDFQGDDDQDFHAYMQTMSERHQRQIVRLLGRKNMAGLERYRQTLDARWEIEDLREQLEASGLALSEQQRRRLITDILAPGVFPPRREYQGTEAPLAVRQEVVASVEKIDGRLRMIAKPILNSAQFAKYSQYLEQRRTDTIRYETPAFAREHGE
jgi:hypothetical protein